MERIKSWSIFLATLLFLLLPVTLVQSQTTTENSTSVTLYPGYTEIYVEINGESQSQELDTAPYNPDGVTLIPVRGVLDALGASIQWLPASRQVQITQVSNQIMLTLDSRTATVNGSPVTLDRAARVVNSRAMIPLRFVSENMGYQVNWYGDEKKIVITRGGATSDSTAPTSESASTLPQTASNASIKILVNNKPIKLSQKPYLNNGGVMVPYLEICPLLNAQAGWDDVNQEVSIKRGARKVHFNSYYMETAWINKWLFDLKTPLADQNGLIFIPLEFTARALDHSFSWDPASNTASIKIGPVINSPSDPQPNRDLWDELGYQYEVGTHWDLYNALLDGNPYKLKDPELVKLLDKSKSIVNTCAKPGMSDFDKVKALHDYIALNTIYGQNTVTEDYPSWTNQLIMYGQGVCVDYANSMLLLCHLAGIECKVVDGRLESPDTWSIAGHEWNIVKIDGQYYHVDVTWDDTGSGSGVSSHYLCMSDDEMAQDHYWDTDDPNLPKCTSTKYANLHSK